MIALMLQANGETRKQLAIAFATSLVAAVGTELGKWAVEKLRAAKTPAADTKP